MAGPWGIKLGIQKLGYLGAIPPPPGPVGVDLGPDPEPMEFLNAFRTYAMQHIDAELLEDRRTQWQSMGDQGPQDQPWWVLRASDELMEYKKILMEDLECDFESVGYWVQLVRKGPMGHMECLRILHHLVKDKDLHLVVPRDPHRSYSKNSRWLKNACLEALQALADPEDWEKGPAHNAKGASKGSWSSYNPLAEPAGPEGKGKSKGPGKDQWASYTASSSSSSTAWRHTGWRG